MLLSVVLTFFCSRQAATSWWISSWIVSMVLSGFISSRAMASSLPSANSFLMTKPAVTLLR